MIFVSAITLCVSNYDNAATHGFQTSQCNLKVGPCSRQSRSFTLFHSNQESVTETELTSLEETDIVGHGFGLYKKFADHALDMLLETEWFQEAPTPKRLASNIAPAKGMSDSVVRISTKALTPEHEHPTAKDLVRYARITLLETIPSSKNDNQEPSSTTTTTLHSQGIHVLNFVVLPSNRTNLPVLGIDLVSLPGSKHLLLLDAQPMTLDVVVAWQDHWKAWHDQHVAAKSNSVFPWGGDFPEPVQQYVSPHSLWTRLQEVEDPITVIQNDVWQAFREHLDLYLELLATYEMDPIGQVGGDNVQPAYLDYRRANDPAKPMLNALYGKEWTEELLNQVLFPK
jgi:Ferredoxin-dependent bilin reductase